MAQKLFSVAYALTLTLPKRYKTMDPSKQFDETKYEIMNAFVLQGAKLTLIAELHDSGDVHYHGIVSLPIITGTSSAHYRLNKIARSLLKDGIIGPQRKFVQIDNYPDWCVYITKDLAITQRNMNCLPIVCDHHNIIDQSVRHQCK